jgi:hypothetical protein
MTNDLVSMDELERESAELLPSRETLTACKYGSYGHGGGGGGFSYTNNDFNPQLGLVNLNQSSVLDGNTINILAI